jgi:hypothetical protein
MGGDPYRGTATRGDVKDSTPGRAEGFAILIDEVDAMTEEEWAAYADTMYMPSRRKQRLFLCAICRRILHLTADERCHRAIAVAERYADGLASLEELQVVGADVSSAIVAAMEAGGEAARIANQEAGEWVRATRRSRAINPLLASFLAATVCRFPLWQRGDDAGIKNLTLLALVNSAEATLFGELKTEAEELHDQRQLLQDIRCPPESSLDPAWLTPTVTGLAATIYDNQAFDRLPILADALEDAGCCNAGILDHSRKPGRHVPGCWVIDLLSGRS